MADPVGARPHAALACSAGLVAALAASHTAAAGQVQLDIFSQQDQRVRAALLQLDLNNLTPLEAMQQLAHLQKLANE